MSERWQNLSEQANKHRFENTTEGFSTLVERHGAAGSTYSAEWTASVSLEWTASVSLAGAVESLTSGTTLQMGRVGQQQQQQPLKAMPNHGKPIMAYWKDRSLQVAHKCLGEVPSS